jgi:hypothetical protein
MKATNGRIAFPRFGIRHMFAAVTLAATILGTVTLFGTHPLTALIAYTVGWGVAGGLVRSWHGAAWGIILGYCVIVIGVIVGVLAAFLWDASKLV